MPSLARFGVIGRGRDHLHPLGRRRTMLYRGVDVLLHVLCGVVHGELAKEELELLVVGLRELRLYVRREIPELLLERAERLLAGLVEELLVGVLFLPFILRV